MQCSYTKNDFSATEIVILLLFYFGIKLLVCLQHYKWDTLDINLTEQFKNPASGIFISLSLFQSLVQAKDPFITEL